MAQRIAATLRINHVELDAVFHQPDWTPLSDEAFAARVASVAEQEAWVVCGNYRLVADLLMARADTVILFDLPRRIVMTRIVRRTLRRVVGAWSSGTATASAGGTFAAWTQRSR